jgi:hypothetical protein
MRTQLDPDAALMTNRFRIDEWGCLPDVVGKWRSKNYRQARRCDLTVFAQVIPCGSDGAVRMPVKLSCWPR